MNFPDALSAGAAAGAWDTPGTPAADNGVVVLTNTNTIPAATKAYLDEHRATATFYGVGKQAATALGDAGYPGHGVYGNDRYETSRQVAAFFFAGAGIAGVATGTNWPDSLAGGALMGTRLGPLVLTNPNAMPPSTASLMSLSSASYDAALIFGGANAVSDDVLQQAGTAISGPPSYFADSFPTAAQQDARSRYASDGSRSTDPGRLPNASSPLLQPLGPTRSH